MIQEPVDRPDLSQPFQAVDTLWPEQERGLRVLGSILLVAGVALSTIHRGLHHVQTIMHWEMGLASTAVLLSLIVMLGFRYRWSRLRHSFLREQRLSIAVYGLWIAGSLFVLLFGPPLADSLPKGTTRADAFLVWTDLCMVLRGMVGLARFILFAAARGINPAIVLASSFLMLITLGTLLLMLPRARAQPLPKNIAAAESAAEQPAAKKVPGAPLLVALFTSTSAACVTGLVVVPTGTYWSRTGQTIILCLFQIGGLGIMTWGALFAVAVRSRMSIGQSATLGEMLESEKLADVRQLLKTILLFTLGAEAVGAVMLSGLWADKPLGEQIFQSVFHSVSAFCNAGFALTIDSFMGWSTRWQVWLAVPLLIILGGLGFAVALNLGFWVRWRWQAFRAERRFELLHHRARISLTARIVLFATVFLLVGGAVFIFLLETPSRAGIDPLSVRIADAWFQSVTFRTAGFNTVDHGALQPSTRLLAILLMFIGASPGSTGGGVKTMTVSVAVLAVFSVLRGRERLEISGRSIPNEQVSRALTIIFLGMLVTMGTTMLLVVFENQPEQFLNHLYEAASACGTVGVSTGLTADLSTPSKLVLIVAMFLGRVGPLTLLLALAGRARTARYEFPSERVVLG